MKINFSKDFFVLFSVFIIIAASLFGFLVYKNVSSTDFIPGWKTYISSNNVYTFQYPDTLGWQVGESDMVNGSFWTQAICQHCKNQNIYLFQIVKSTIKNLREFPDKSPTFTDFTKTTLGNIDALMALHPGSTQSPTCVEIFIVHTGQGYSISQCFSQDLIGVKKLSDLPKPFPDIFSTFKFIKKNKVICGGIMGAECPIDEGYTCEMDGPYPDASGTCVKQPSSRQP